MIANAANQEKLKLWKESLRCFGRHWKPWLKLAVWFVVVMAALSFFIQPDEETIRRLKEASDKTNGVPPSFAAMMMAFGIATAVITVIQYYFFNLFFLSREQVFAKPLKPNPAGFLYYIGQRLLSILLTMLPALIGVGAVALLQFLVKGTEGPVKTIGGIVTAVIAFAGYLFAIYVGIKYFLVGVLACGRMRAALKTSWTLTEGNWWRVLGSSLMLSFLALLILIPVSLLAQGGAAVFPLLKPVALVVNAAFGVVFGGVLSAFGCTALRILQKERRQADPSFALISKE